MFDHLGFIPNGARNYFLNRSQPPFLSLMIDRYYQETKDRELLERAVPVLKKEHDFWVNNRSTIVTDPNRFGSRQFQFFVFNVTNNQPRPEGYSNDWYAAHNATKDEKKQQELYAQYATGAESGWDYTVRWAREPYLKNPKVLETLRVNKIIPPELNSLVYALESTISKLSQELGNTDDVAKYKQLATQRQKDMVDFMIDPSTGFFSDWSLEDKAFTGIWSIAGFWPYWQLSDSIDLKLAQKAIGNLAPIVSKYPGGVPTTLIESGLQWDFPDAWPPHQYVLIKALLNLAKSTQVSPATKCSSTPSSGQNPDDLAQNIAQHYISNAFCGWYDTGGSIPGLLNKLSSTNDTGHMFEKYNAITVGESAGGGEYTVQVGFGWSNGVSLWVLEHFGKSLAAPQCPKYSTNL